MSYPIRILYRLLFVYDRNDDALHELALREEEYDRWEYDGNNSSCHCVSRVTAKWAEEIANARRQRIQVSSPKQVHKRVEVVVPGVEKMKEGYSDNRRDRLWDDHGDQYPQRACAVNHGRFVQFFGHSHKILAQ